MGRPIRNVRISENFVPVSEFKAQAAAWLRKAGETGAPIVVTQNGKPAGVLLSPEVFDELTEQARFMAAVEEGLADADSGRVQSHAAAARRMRRRFGGKGE
jgi:prevent-host-death family protein